MWGGVVLSGLRGGAVILHVVVAILVQKLSGRRILFFPPPSPPPSTWTSLLCTLAMRGWRLHHNDDSNGTRLSLSVSVSFIPEGDGDRFTGVKRRHSTSHSLCLFFVCP